MFKPVLFIITFVFFVSCTKVTIQEGRLYGGAFKNVQHEKAQQFIPQQNYGPPSLYPAEFLRRQYKLPYSEGKAFECMDGYFSDPMGHPVWSDHPDYSLDFRMPEGEPILASRAGIVTKIVAKTPPQVKGTSNYLVISRNDTLSDGRVVKTKDTYEHIRQDIPVAVGDTIEQGDIIAYNSNSGCFHMHLHFEVNIEGHEGVSLKKIGGDGRTFTSIPTPYVEVERAGGYPVLGEYWVSKNVPRVR